MTTFNKPKKRISHNYTNELELKSLILRFNNREMVDDKLAPDNSIESIAANKYIYRLIEIYKKTIAKKTKCLTRKSQVKSWKIYLKSEIIARSVETTCDKISYEKFGYIVLLMIKHILMKPNFSGYTYVDDFYSDAVYKINKYVHNFDHTKISEITNQPVNAFAYVSTCIHNAIIFILKKKQQELDIHKKRVLMETLDDEYQMKYIDLHIDDRTIHHIDAVDIHEVTIRVNRVSEFSHCEFPLLEKLKLLIDQTTLNDDDKLSIIYPSDYRISYDEYVKISPLLKGTVSITRAGETEDE